MAFWINYISYTSIFHRLYEVASESFINSMQQIKKYNLKVLDSPTDALFYLQLVIQLCSRHAGLDLKEQRILTTFWATLFAFPAYYLHSLYIISIVKKKKPKMTAIYVTKCALCTSHVYVRVVKFPYRIIMHIKSFDVLITAYIINSLVLTGFFSIITQFVFEIGLFPTCQDVLFVSWHIESELVYEKPLISN